VRNHKHKRDNRRMDTPIRAHIHAHKTLDTVRTIERNRVRQVASGCTVRVVGKVLDPGEKVLNQIKETHVSMELVLSRLGACPKASHEGCKDKDVKE